MASRTVSILEIGETTTVPIRARAYWNDTGIAVRIGEHYRLRAEGSWRDFLITSGPDGYETPWYSLGQRLASPLRRVPNARWFALSAHDFISVVVCVGIGGRLLNLVMWSMSARSR